MTVVGVPEAVAIARPEPHHGASGLLKWLTSTDHKVIGMSYLITSFLFFLISGCMAIIIRTQLMAPDNTVVSQHTYNELFTMHGSLMMYLFAGPFAFGGLANFLVPLQVGAPDMAFPRLNALSYWLYLGGGLTIVSGFFVAGGAANFGWVAYAPLSDSVNSPGAGPDMWIVGLILTGFSAIFTAVNLITTIFYLRAPGLTMFRLPIFVWDMLVTAILILIAFPVLTSALVLLWCDRHIGSHIYTVVGGGVPVLWQNLFWFFGHPEVYILVLPFFGVVTEIIAVFSKKPVFGYPGMVFATVAIGALSTAVWAHHMFTTGTTLLPFFSLMSYLIAVPTGIKYFNWIGTMWRGSVSYSAAMLFAVGFLFVFLFGGVTGVLVASPPLDFALHDTYFVVAHFHQVLAGSAEFAGFGAIYYWYPKITGRFLREGLGRASFWFLFVGFLTTFMPQYLLGLHGMPRRIAEYSTASGWQALNDVSSVGAYLLFVAVLFTVVNFYVSWRRPVLAPPNPWDGHALEWATSSPPPEHNFEAIPPIRSERPVWDFNHPEEADHAWVRDFASLHVPPADVARHPPRPEGEGEPQTPGEQGPEIASLLRSEHARLMMLLAETVAEQDRRARRRRFTEFSRALVRHEFAEQLALRPLVRRTTAGPVLEAEVVKESRATSRALLRVQHHVAWRPGGRRTLREIDAFRPRLEHHCRVSERVLLPLVTDLEPALNRHILGTWTERVATLAPTRPHPHLPGNIVELALVGATLARVDRIRDRLRFIMRHW